MKARPGAPSSFPDAGRRRQPQAAMPVAAPAEAVPPPASVDGDTGEEEIRVRISPPPADPAPR